MSDLAKAAEELIKKSETAESAQSAQEYATAALLVTQAIQNMNRETEKLSAG